MAFNPGSGMIVASKSTPEGIHGIHKISLVDNLNANHVVNPHSRAIRDLQCSSSGLCLTTSLDGTAKISSLSNNCVVQRYAIRLIFWRNIIPILTCLYLATIWTLQGGVAVGMILMRIVCTVASSMIQLWCLTFETHEITFTI